MLIAIDAGHGGKDPGAIANGLSEKDITLLLALKVGNYLITNYNCEVIFTRTTDVYLSLSERANIANKAKADLFCSIHINSLNSVSKGFETYRYPGTKGKTSELQKSVHDEVMNALKPYNIIDRGMKQKNLAVIRETAMPALLTEVLFISNPTEAELLKSEVFLNKVAEAHAVGLANAAGLKGKDSIKEPQKKYYLITGSFENKEIAEKSAKMLKEKYGWHIDIKET